MTSRVIKYNEYLEGARAIPNTNLQSMALNAGIFYISPPQPLPGAHAAGFYTAILCNATPLLDRHIP